jgi:hypothetical protein
MSRRHSSQFTDRCSILLEISVAGIAPFNLGGLLTEDAKLDITLTNIVDRSKRYSKP